LLADFIIIIISSIRQPTRHSATRHPLDFRNYPDQAENGGTCSRAWPAPAAGAGHARDSSNPNHIQDALKTRRRKNIAHFFPGGPWEIFF
jgi:hypothetical protein